MSLALACETYKALLYEKMRRRPAPRAARGAPTGPRPAGGQRAQRPRPLVMQDILFSTKFNVTTLRIPYRMYASYTLYVASSEDMNENVQYSHIVFECVARDMEGVNPRYPITVPDRVVYTSRTACQAAGCYHGRERAREASRKAGWKRAAVELRWSYGGTTAGAPRARPGRVSK